MESPTQVARGREMLPSRGVQQKWTSLTIISQVRFICLEHFIENTTPRFWWIHPLQSLVSRWLWIPSLWVRPRVSGEDHRQRLSGPVQWPAQQEQQEHPLHREQLHLRQWPPWDGQEPRRCCRLYDWWRLFKNWIWTTLGKSATTTMVAPGGQTLSGHVSSGIENTIRWLVTKEITTIIWWVRNGNFDVVVIQDQSQRPSFGIGWVKVLHETFCSK